MPERFESGHVESYQFVSAQEEVKATVFLPVIDHISAELAQRFLSDSSTVLC